MTTQNGPRLVLDIIGATDKHIEKRLAASALKGKSAEEKYAEFTRDFEQSVAYEVFDLLISELAWGSTIFRVELSLTRLKDAGAARAFGLKFLERKGYICTSAQTKTLPSYAASLEYVDFQIDWDATEKALLKGGLSVCRRGLSSIYLRRSQKHLRTLPHHPLG